MGAAGLLAALLLSLIPAVWMSPAQAQLPPLGIAVGNPFPEVPLLRAGDGSLASISDYRGEKLVLHVFASW